MSADALTRCQRYFAALESADPPAGPDVAASAAADAPDAPPRTPPGATLPGVNVLRWYREASRTVLGMTEAQLRRDALAGKRDPKGAGPADANLSDAALVSALLDSITTADLSAALRARGVDVIDVPSVPVRSDDG